MELKQLKYLVTIVESGSFGKAAQKLDVGTSALSQQISKLEDELCTRLLRRSTTGKEAFGHCIIPTVSPA